MKLSAAPVEMTVFGVGEEASKNNDNSKSNCKKSGCAVGLRTGFPASVEMTMWGGVWISLTLRRAALAQDPVKNGRFFRPISGGDVADEVGWGG